MFAAGELQITANAPASLVNLVAGGEKISFFLGLSNTSPFSVVTQPNLRRAEDLRGKKIGTACFGGSSHISALIALEHLGLDHKCDKITLIQTGVDPDRMVALENKAIDAGMLQRQSGVLIGNLCLQHVEQRIVTFGNHQFCCNDEARLCHRQS